jgi:hypothetical protein
MSSYTFPGDQAGFENGPAPHEDAGIILANPGSLQALFLEGSKIVVTRRPPGNTYTDEASP